LNNTASHNTFLGRSTGEGNTTGDSNTFLGHSAGYNNSTGRAGTYIGRAAGYQNNGEGNTLIGYFAGYNNTSGDSNIFLGFQAGYYEYGSHKLYIDSSSTSSPLIYGEFDNNVIAFMGTVGVGTKSPAYPMEMKKTGTNASIVVNRTDGVTNFINATDSFGNFGTVTDHPLRLNVDSIWRLRLDSDNSLRMKSGATCSAGGMWVNASSRALKENIESLEVDEAIDALERLNPVKYNYKTDKQEECLGFIAEDVPDLVSTKDRKGMASMDVVAVLTKVLQEQQKTIEELKAEVERLKKESDK